MCSSLPDSKGSVLQQPQEEPWTSIDHQCINGEQEVIVWGETEVQINQAHGTDQLNLSLKAGQETSEEVEQWEQIIWPVRPMTCTSPPISFATVQWDMPGTFTEMPSLMTDRSLANELDSGGVTSLDTTSLSLHQSDDDNAEPVVQGENEEEDGFDSRLLNLNLEWTGNGFEVCSVLKAVTQGGVMLSC